MAEEKSVQLPTGLSGRIDDDLTYGPQNARRAKFAGVGNRGTTGRKISRAGHVLQFNDTSGQESIVIQHSSGKQSIVLANDGTVSIEGEQLVITVGKDATVSISGNATYNVDGNMDFNVSGDMNVNCSKFNLTTKQYKENIKTSKNSYVKGPRRETTIGSHSQETTGSFTSLVLGSYHNNVKNEINFASEGSSQYLSGDKLKISAENQAIIASKSINATSDNLSLLGKIGYIGGPNVNHFGLEMEATTFWGDLNGTAKLAITADYANTQNYPDPPLGGGVGAPSGYSINYSNERPTAPNLAQLTGTLNTTDKGPSIVKIDADALSEQYERSTHNNGNGVGDLTPDEIVNLCRDGQDTTLIGNYVAEGSLGSGAMRTAPANTGRIATSTPEQLSVDIGSTGGVSSWLTPPNLSVRRSFTPPPNNIIAADTLYIDGNTQLLPGIRLSTFFVDAGDDTRTKDAGSIPQQTGYSGR